MRADDRPLAVWTNVHDNGWVANAFENMDGTFLGLGIAECDRHCRRRLPQRRARERETSRRIRAFAEERSQAVFTALHRMASSLSRTTLISARAQTPLQAREVLTLGPGI